MVINTPAACLQIKTHSVVTHGTILYIPKKEKSANETMTHHNYKLHLPFRDIK